MTQLHALFKKLPSNMILTSWKWNEWVEKDVSCKHDQRVTGLDTLILEKVDFRVKKIMGGGILYNNKGVNQWRRKQS